MTVCWFWHDSVQWVPYNHTWPLRGLSLTIFPLSFSSFLLLFEDVIEARYQVFRDGSCAEIMIFEHGEFFYEINFRTMTQKNLSTWTERPVERKEFRTHSKTVSQFLTQTSGIEDHTGYALRSLEYLCYLCRILQHLKRINFVESNLPNMVPKWFPMDTESPSASDIIPLDKSSLEYQQVEQHFRSTMMKAVIRRVYRVQNILLWNRFLG